LALIEGVARILRAPQKSAAVALANGRLSGTLSRWMNRFAMNWISSVRVPFCGDFAKLDRLRGRA
jgi:hypothetical protein